MKANSLHDLYLEQLSDLYDAEHQSNRSIAQDGEGRFLTRIARLIYRISIRGYRVIWIVTGPAAVWGCE
jgi:hypothetical protein